MAITIYWVVYANGAGKPSNDQIRLGQNSGGTAALESGSALYTAGGTLTFPPVITVLAPNTAYQEAFVAYDDVALTYSNSVESATITTEAITPISVSVNESFALTTVENAKTVYNGVVNDSVTVTDSQNATVTTGPVTYPVSVNESVTVTDSQNASSTKPGTVAESVVVTDSQNASVTGAGVIPVSVNESIALTDSQNTTATYRRQVNEGVTLIDAQNARSTLQVSRAESITLSATQDATKQSPQVIPVTVSELITLIAQQDAYIPGKPDRRVGRFGDPVKKSIQEAEKAMIELEDEFILEIVLSLAVKGAIA